MYQITPSAGVGGTISPSTVQDVPYGTDATFIITADAGYQIADVFVDSSSVGPVSTYTFTNVTANHTIAATFAINTYTVTFNSEGGSAVDPQSVAYGGKVTEPTAPTKDGFTFGGWYKEEACTTPWDFANDTVTMDTTLYAKWTINTSYTFTLSLLPSWNVISVPFSTPVSSLTTCDSFYSWDGQFWKPETMLLPGTGYLVHNTAGTTTAVTLTGTPVSSPQTQPATGTWQIIGNPYMTSASLTCDTPVQYLYTWGGQFWNPVSATNLLPGQGFLFKASASGTITLTLLP
jgi:uncharacterized repeat protein (TIGR02543 family)